AVQHLISRVAKAGHNAHSGNHNPSHTILLPVPPAQTAGDFSVSHSGPKCRRFVRFAIFDLGKGHLSRYIMAITYKGRPEKPKPVSQGPETTSANKKESPVRSLSEFLAAYGESHQNP